MVNRLHFIKCLLICLVTGLICQSCASVKMKRTLATFFSESGPFDNHFVGFALFDPNNEKWIFKHQVDKYFTPASNTKILTLYAALHYLQDSMVGAAFQERGDTLYVWGMGDPTFLHSEFVARSNLLQQINERPSQHVAFCRDHFKDFRFGAGWAWDDFAYSYQVEKSPLPIYANRVRIQLDSATKSITYTPAQVEIHHQNGDDFSITRNELDNQFKTQWSQGNQPSGVFQIPLHRYPNDLAWFLAPYTNKKISVQEQCPPLTNDHLIRTTALDTVYRKLMHESDNFIAEQLLLQISALELGEMRTSEIIAHIKRDIMSEVSDQLLWYDGSGLSRYNMFTPAAIVYILYKIKSMVPPERLWDIFPAGGKSGTIRSLYASDPPFVYAKTGTLRNKHCLSGYLVTDSGKTLIFSFMHNNFAGPSADTKPGMDMILRHIKSKY